MGEEHAGERSLCRHRAEDEAPPAGLVGGIIRHLTRDDRFGNDPAGCKIRGSEQILAGALPGVESPGPGTFHVCHPKAEEELLLGSARYCFLTGKLCLKCHERLALPGLEAPEETSCPAAGAFYEDVFSGDTEPAFHFSSCPSISRTASSLAISRIVPSAIR